MRRMVAKVVLGVLLVATMTAGAAASDGTGPYSGAGAVFQIGAGARPLGMGGTFVGVADDENALFYNPAGLAYLRRAGLTSLYSTQYDVLSYGALGVATRGFGLGALYLAPSEDIPGTGENSEILDSFSYSNLAGLAGLGGNVGPFAVGLRGKFLRVTSATIEGTGQNQAIRAVNGSGFDVDAAALINLGVVRIGALCENVLGQALTYDTAVKEPFERRLTAGASLHLGPLLLAADVENLTGETRYYHAGGEVRVGLLSLRGGATGPLGGASGAKGSDLSAGAGISFGAFQVDYAYLMPRELPQTHRLSLTLRF